MVDLALIDGATNPARAQIDRKDSTLSDASQARKSLNDDLDEFMLLLTTQLQNQDPTEPLDTNEFTSQLVEFASVEQAIAGNENLEKLVNLTSNQQVNGAVSFVGKTVEVEGRQGFLKNGTAEFAYDVPPGVASVTLAVLDASGNPVYSTQGPNFAGRQIFAWDGTNSFTDQVMQDGLYSFGVAARDEAGEIVDIQTYTTGRVTGVVLDQEDLTMTIGGVFDVTMDQVVSVREAVEDPAAQQQGANDQNDQADEG